MIAATFRAGNDVLRPRWLVAGLLVFFAAIHLLYLSKLTHSEQNNRSAFLRWRVQLQDLDEGVNVWDKYAYPNPPIMALLLQPFHQLPPLLGASVWFCVKSLLALAAILMVLAMFDDSARPFPLWGKLLAVGLTLRPIEGDLVHGNVNLFILFLIVAALLAFCKRQEYVAGLLLGLSIACKLTPGLFIVYFLWKRAWKTLLGIAVGLVVFVLAVPAACFGWDTNLLYLRSWHRQMVAPYAAGVVTSEHKNQSLPGLLHRMLSEEASFSDYVGDQKIVLETHNLVALDRDTVQAIVLGCGAICFLLAGWRCRTPTDQRPSLRLLAEFSVVLLGMLLFCERTWKHHCVILLLPFSVVAYGVSTQVASRGTRRYLGITLAVVAVLMYATSSGHLDAGVESQARFGKWAQVYGAYVWAFLLLGGSMLVLLKPPPGKALPSPAAADSAWVSRDFTPELANGNAGRFCYSAGSISADIEPLQRGIKGSGPKA